MWPECSDDELRAVMPAVNQVIVGILGQQWPAYCKPVRRLCFHMACQDALQILKVSDGFSSDLCNCHGTPENTIVQAFRP